MAPGAGGGRCGERSATGVQDLRVPGLISPAASSGREANLGLWKWKTKAQQSRAPPGRFEEKRKAKMQEEMKGFLLTKVDLDRVYKTWKVGSSSFLAGFRAGTAFSLFPLSGYRIR